MVRGLYTSGVAMSAIMNTFDVVSNNIANVDTTGYKKDVVITQSFSEELMNRLNDPNPNMIEHSVKIGNMSLGVFVDTIATDFSNGAITVTDNSFDFALTGDGFFSIQTQDENGQAVEMYSRDGTFTKDNGLLVTKEGNLVLGENGPIQLPEGIVTVDSIGNVTVDGQFIDRLKLVNFTDNSTLRKYQDSLYTTTADSSLGVFTSSVQQGALESSNINPVKEMVDMITVNRLYEANQRVITTIDQTLNRSVNDIARK